jgi:hypothetical protein
MVVIEFPLSYFHCISPLDVTHKDQRMFFFQCQQTDQHRFVSISRPPQFCRHLKDDQNRFAISTCLPFQATIGSVQLCPGESAINHYG